MLRIGLKTSEAALTVFHGHQFHWKISTSRNAKIHSRQQGKIINKLFGERLTGSKRKWYPSDETTGSTKAINLKSSQFGKSGAGGTKNNATRRMTVLNKVFMSHITDLLTTGAVSEVVGGHGLQVTRVKISSDFGCINVYWLGCGDTVADSRLEQALQKAAGLLRHELSQLKFVGEVPRVRFAREKTYRNQAQVEALIGSKHFQTEQNHDHHVISHMMKLEFFGEKKKAEKIANMDKAHAKDMRHDVLGLDHCGIMLKILTKMRRSKLAWESHNECNVSDPPDPVNLYNVDCSDNANTPLKGVNLKLSKTARTTENFDTFLGERKERKITPDRKKYNSRDEHINDSNNINVAVGEADEYILTKNRRQLYEEEDYICDDLK